MNQSFDMQVEEMEELVAPGIWKTIKGYATGVSIVLECQAIAFAERII